MVPIRKTYKARQAGYQHVKALPENALTVSAYCKQHEYTNPYFYQLARQGKGDFKIVVFQGINFVIPSKSNTG